MPPKKADTERILLGRPSNNLKIGIVGLPNVGYAPRAHGAQAVWPAPSRPFLTPCLTPRFPVFSRRVVQQVDVLQRDHQQRNRGGELPVLHHRSALHYGCRPGDRVD